MPTFLKNKKYYGERIFANQKYYFFAGIYDFKGNQFYLYLNCDLSIEDVAIIDIVFKCKFKRLFNVILNECGAKKAFSGQDSNSFYFLYRGWHFRLSDHIHPVKGRKDFFEILIGATNELVEVNGTPINKNIIKSVNDVYYFVASELRKTNKKPVNILPI